MKGPLFVTRRFPPSVGGMETLAAETWRAIEGVSGARLIAHRGASRGLLRWLPGAVIATRRAIRRGEVDCLLLGDGVVAAIVVPMLGRRRPRVVTMAMGLDLTFDRFGYSQLLRRALARSDLVLAISRSTAELAVGHGVEPDRVVPIRLGVAAPTIGPEDRAASRAQLDAMTGGATTGRPLVGTLGRLVERKGYRWFVHSVLPELTDAHYVIAGSGSERPAIEDAALRAGVAERVHLLGRVDVRGREAVLQGVDVFVQPNVEVPGDVEGFGLVAIEAAMRGTPVLAADLQGLKDAVVHDRTGLLVAAGDAAAWAASVRDLITQTALPATGAAWAVEARRLYGPEQFRAAIRDAVGLATRTGC